MLPMARAATSPAPTASAAARNESNRWAASLYRPARNNSPPSRSCASRGERRAVLASAEIRDFALDCGTDLGTVPTSEKMSKQQAKTLAVFKTFQLRAWCRKSNKILVFLWRFPFREYLQR